MKTSERKQMLLALFVCLLVLFLAQYIIVKVEFAREKIVTIVLPQETSVDCARIMDGIRDYAKYHDILLDVWYEDTISASELEALITEENNHAIGILLLYPESYIDEVLDEYYSWNKVLVITETMKSCFSNIAAFEEINEIIYSIPISPTVIKKLMEDKNDYIYIKNTYELGYRCMEQIEDNRHRSKIGDICLGYIKVDAAVIEDGSIEFLLTE